MKRKTFTFLQIASICMGIFLCSNMGYSQWSTNGSSIVYTFDKVGIGISNPTYKLHVEAPANSWKARFSGDDGYIDIGPANSGWAHIYSDRPKFIFNKPVWSIGGAFSSYSSDNLYLQTNGTNRITVLNSNGNVGIGTNLPQAKLNVIGNIYVDGRITFKDASSYYNSIQNDGSGYMIFNVGPTPAIMKLTSNSVSIGCGGSSGRLNVNGKIQATEIEIKSGPCSDYVFKEDYNLMDLIELSEYVKVNKHLPEVPSAKEFQDNGYSLGEMDDLLLRKIEELTLYVIEQNKRIEALESENSSLKKR